MPWMNQFLAQSRTDAEAPRTAANRLLLVACVFVSLATIAAVLGLIGLLRVRTDVAPKPDWLQFVSALLGLYGNQYPSWIPPGQGLPTSLQVARFIAPLSTGYVFLTSAAVVLGEHVRLVRAGIARGHSVVVGGGQRGVLLSRSLAREHNRAVLVQRAGAATGYRPSFTGGVIPLAGDPTDPLVLRGAGVARARELFAISDDARANASVALSSRSLRPEVGRRFDCYVFVSDSHLQAALEARLMSMAQRPDFRLHLIDRHQLLARHLLHDSVFAPTDTTVVLGDGLLARAVVMETGRRAYASTKDAGNLCGRLLVAGPTATGLWKDARSATPRGFWERLTVETRDQSPWDFVCDSDLRAALGSPVTGRVVVYVCTPDDDAALKWALTMVRQTVGIRAEVTACIEDGTGFTTAFADGPVRLFDDASGTFRIVSASDVLGEVDRVRSASTTETIARAFHGQYLHHVIESGTSDTDARHVVEWSALPERARESNRAQAWDIGAKLRLLGCAILPLGESCGAFAFRDDEIESLGRAEHERWLAEKAAQGIGRGRRSATSHPDMRPWEELSEPVREKDRIFIRALPRILAEEGYAIVRLRTPVPSGAIRNGGDRMDQVDRFERHDKESPCLGSS